MRKIYPFFVIFMMPCFVTFFISCKKSSQEAKQSSGNSKLEQKTNCIMHNVTKALANKDHLSPQAQPSALLDPLLQNCAAIPKELYDWLEEQRLQNIGRTKLVKVRKTLSKTYFKLWEKTCPKDDSNISPLRLSRSDLQKRINSLHLSCSPVQQLFSKSELPYNLRFFHAVILFKWLQTQGLSHEQARSFLRITFLSKIQHLGVSLLTSKTVEKYSSNTHLIMQRKGSLYLNGKLLEQTPSIPKIGEGKTIPSLLEALEQEKRRTAQKYKKDKYSLLLSPNTPVSQLLLISNTMRQAGFNSPAILVSGAQIPYLGSLKQISLSIANNQVTNKSNLLEATTLQKDEHSLQLIIKRKVIKIKPIEGFSANCSLLYERPESMQESKALQRLFRKMQICLQEISQKSPQIKELQIHASASTSLRLLIGLIEASRSGESEKRLFSKITLSQKDFQ